MTLCHVAQSGDVLFACFIFLICRYCAHSFPMAMRLYYFFITNSTSCQDLCLLPIIFLKDLPSGLDDQNCPAVMRSFASTKQLCCTISGCDNVTSMHSGKTNAPFQNLISNIIIKNTMNVMWTEAISQLKRSRVEEV